MGDNSTLSKKTKRPSKSPSSSRTSKGKNADDSSDKILNVNFLKKWKHKLKKIGVDASDLPPKQQEDAKEVAGYSRVLDSLNECLLDVLQRDPEYQKPSLSDQQIVTPSNMTGFEKSSKSFQAMKNTWKSPELTTALCRVANECGKQQRDMQKNDRLKLHSLRKFLNFELEEFDAILRDLKSDKERVDIAKEEMDARPDNERKKIVFDKSNKKCNATIAKMDDWMKKFQAKKLAHRSDIIEYLKEQEKYHTEMATKLKGIKKNMVYKPVRED